MDAKDFLASRIAAEAVREGKPLSELERQMLFFTETHESLPNILEINEQFEQQYDATVYEETICELARNAYARDAKNSPADRQRWDDAIRRLETEDHYILVMLRAADLGGFASAPVPSLFSMITGFFKSRRS
jgi:hypothetical protein